MPIIVKQERNFQDPPAGIPLAVCVDVTEPKEYDTAFGKKRKFRIVWEIEDKMTDGDKTGQPYLASCFYTPSLNEKSKLYKHLSAWRGKPFSDEELEGFDVENILGACCRLVIEEYLDGKGKTRTKVSNVVKAKKGEKLEASGEYIRVKDREDQKDEPTPTTHEDLSESDVPF